NRKQCRSRSQSSRLPNCCENHSRLQPPYFRRRRESPVKFSPESRFQNCIGALASFSDLETLARDQCGDDHGLHLFRNGIVSKAVHINGHVPIFLAISSQSWCRFSLSWPA